MSYYFIQHSLAIKKQLHSHFSSSRNETISALELGSGNGLLSACFLSSIFGGLNEAIANDSVRNIYLCDLYVTDMSDHISLMKQTFVLNQNVLHLSENNTMENGEDYSQDTVVFETKNHDENAKNNRTRVIITPHEWGVFDSNTDDITKQNELLHKKGKLDFIFGSDVAYRPYLYQPLISSLCYFSHSKTVILLGISMNDTRSKFFHDLVEAGFHYERISDSLMESKFRGNHFGLFIVTPSYISNFPRK